MIATSSAAELCAACPRLCSFSCPVSEVTGRTALTPWGKVSLAQIATGPGRAPEASASLAFAACTGCLRCQQHCAHGNDVPALLQAARAVSVRSGTAPSAYAAVATRMAARGHAEERDLLAVHRALRDSPSASASAPAAASMPLLLPGCDALAAGGEEALLALRVARALGAPLRLGPEGMLCCGQKLLDAGHPELYEAHALRARSALLATSGGRKREALHLVFLSPGCARAAEERLGLPEGSRLEHVTSYLAGALAARPELSRLPRLPGAATLHDPCDLARGLCETSAPRALLTAALEGGVREPVRCGVETSCCGAAGLLPRALPAEAAALGEARAAELAACGAPAVTSSPACAAHLGIGSIVGVLARWLSVTDRDAPA